MPKRDGAFRRDQLNHHLKRGMEPWGRAYRKGKAYPIGVIGEAAPPSDHVYVPAANRAYGADFDNVVAIVQEPDLATVRDLDEDKPAVEVGSTDDTVHEAFVVLNLLRGHSGLAGRGAEAGGSDVRVVGAGMVTDR